MSNKPIVFERIQEKLNSSHIQFTVQHHEPAFTSQESAARRGVSLNTGAKALICKVDGIFCMYVIPADRQLASKRIRKSCGAKSLRFANQDEVWNITGLTPGSIPPFGSLFDGHKAQLSEEQHSTPKVVVPEELQQTAHYIH